jgi:L-serine dehydratase
MQKVSSIFDIIGPVMVGPSSSHTAGAVRLGALARGIYGGDISEALIQLHGSFAATAEGHGTKRALAAGLLGMAVDDVRIVDALEIAEQTGCLFTFEKIDLDDSHPNTVVFTLGTDPEQRVIQGSSIGGGNVVISNVDGFEVEFDGTLPLLMLHHKDRPGTVSAITAVLADVGTNIATMQVSRAQRGKQALTLIETDTSPTDEVLEELAHLKQIKSVSFIPVV